jgi:hypothetical protein
VDAVAFGIGQGLAGRLKAQKQTVAAPARSPYQDREAHIRIDVGRW